MKVTMMHKNGNVEVIERVKKMVIGVIERVVNIKFIFWKKPDEERPTAVNYDSSLWKIENMEKE